MDWDLVPVNIYQTIAGQDRSRAIPQREDALRLFLLVAVGLLLISGLIAGNLMLPYQWAFCQLVPSHSQQD